MSIIKRKQGFTLLEMMLVILIMAAIAFFAIRMEQQKFKQVRANRAASQINQILAAATSYYIDNGDWPYDSNMSKSHWDEAANITYLTSKAHYLPQTWLPTTGSDSMPSPYGSPYVLGPMGTSESETAKQPMYSVSLDNLSETQANILKAKLPMSYIEKLGDSYKLTAFISIPSYDYNHAKTVSDVGVYHPGDCVPKPSYACPRGMHAATFVTVEQAYGFGQGTTASNSVVYPITGISAYAIPITQDDNGASETCPFMPENASYSDDSGNHSVNPISSSCQKGYDRVCIRVETTNGTLDFSKFSDNLKNTVGNTELMAMTKCVPNNNHE